MLVCLFLLIYNTIIPISYSREISKAGQIFQEVKDGVVTIVRAGHGSGFLVDDSGLILTNSHVVNDAGNELRVRFGPDQVIWGKVVENDRDADVAVIWVNLKNISQYKVLKPFVPPEGEKLVLVGEKVLVIGSPLEWEVLEKTLSEGVAGKFENDVISYDAVTNPGNSGGPLMNFDGQVIGLHTFASATPNGQISGVKNAVAITKALPLIASAKEKIKTMELPSADLLPDISKVSFPISKLLIDEAKNLPNRVIPYHIESSFFAIDIKTPPLGYKQLKKYDENILKHRKARAKQKGFQISDDEYEHKNAVKFYSYDKPVVHVTVIPKPKLTAGSKVFNTVAFVAATGVTAASFGIGAPLMAVPFMMGKKEFKKDFLKLTLQSVDKSTICQPFLSARQPFTEEYAFFTQYSYEVIVDKSYVGVYEFDSKCFESTKPMEFVLETEGEKKQLPVSLPEKIKKNVVTDFKPYWEYVAKLNKLNPTSTQATQSSTTKEIKTAEPQHPPVNALQLEETPKAVPTK